MVDALSIKLSELLRKKIYHITFDQETVIHFEDGSRLTIEYSEGEYSEYTKWSDTEVRYYKNKRTIKWQSVEVDTQRM